MKRNKFNIKNKLRRYLIIAAILLQFGNTIVSAQTTYYVDASIGNDNNSGTSQNLAWKTLVHVSNRSFLPGDSILLKRNEVFPDSLYISSSGNEKGKITIGAYGEGAKPLIRITDKKVIGAISVMFHDFVTIENIEITGECRYGIWMRGGKNNTIQDCFIHHIAPGRPWHGIITGKEPKNLKILRNEISYCGLEGYYGNSENIEIAYNYIHHIDLVNAGGDCVQLNLHAPNFHVHHNIFDRSMIQGGKGCVVCSDTLKFTNGLFEYNTCINAPGDNFGFSAPNRGCTVRYNIFKGAASSQYAVKGPHLIHHNTFDNYLCAFDFGIQSSDYKVYNNIFRNIQNYVIYVPKTPHGDRYVDYEFKNNISDNAKFRDTSNGKADRSHNIYTQGSASDSHSLVTNPMFVSENDFHLKTGSPAQNAGVDVGLSKDFEGNDINKKPSIGIYEKPGERK